MSINFFVPTESKATSKRASPPMGFRETIMPRPKAVCSTRSPLWKGTLADDGGAALAAAGRLAVGWGVRPPMLMPPPRGLPERLPPEGTGME